MTLKLKALSEVAPAGGVPLWAGVTFPLQSRKWQNRQQVQETVDEVGSNTLSWLWNKSWVMVLLKEQMFKTCWRSALCGGGGSFNVGQGHQPSSLTVLYALTGHLSLLWLLCRCWTDTWSSSLSEIFLYHIYFGVFPPNHSDPQIIKLLFDQKNNMVPVKLLFAKKGKRDVALKKPHLA